ncbi:MAG: C40 family peptidase [Bacteroidales bacterium]|nr:C40 family peptidase [Bacteroidales bacterium]
MKRTIAAILIATAVSFAAGAQQKRMAVADLSTIYMRQQPDYESALETQELMGTVVEIVSEKGYWREIVSPQPYRAWATEKGLVEMTAEELAVYEAAQKVMFTGLYGHVYTSPSADSQTLCDLVGGDLMRLKSPDSSLRKGRLKGRWTKVILPSGREGFVPSGQLKPHNGFISIAQGEGSAESVDAETAEAIIAEAEKLLGSPYLWGGMSAKGVDCSGLVRISFLMNGILLPRNASQQINCGDRIPMEIDRSFWDESVRESDREALKKEMGKRIMNLERGDLVFFGTPASTPEGKDRITHVGIYLGNGNIIHSSHMVRHNSLLPDNEEYYENSWRLLGAIRL